MFRYFKVPILVLETFSNDKVKSPKKIGHRNSPVFK